MIISSETTIQNFLKVRDRHFLEVHGVVLYGYQREISDTMVRAVLSKNGQSYGYSISRQSGKTEAVVGTIEFLMIYLPKITKAPFRVGIFAPQKEQAKTDFDRLKEKMNRSIQGGYQEVIDPEESNAVTMRLTNGSFCYIFPLTKTSHPESKTLDLLIYEEANKIDDKEKKDKADPMGTSTNAPSFSVGVGGYSINYFYRMIQRGINVKEYDCDEVIKQRRVVYEKTKNENHLLYERFVDQKRKEWGENDDSFRTQYLLKWIIGKGQFVTREVLDKLRGDFKRHVSRSRVVVGIDTAKIVDSTVVTVKDIDNGKICDWMELQGDNYEDQFYAIMAFIGQYKSVEGVAIDSTGQGDFMPDMFENHTEYRIERVKFSAVMKDQLYKNLLVVIQNLLTSYPQGNDEVIGRFEEQLLDLQKQYKGILLSCHHPEGSKDGEVYHDDYPDSWALAEWMHRLVNEGGDDIVATVI